MESIERRSYETALSITAVLCRFRFNNRYADETHENTRRRRSRAVERTMRDTGTLYKGIKAGEKYESCMPRCLKNRKRVEPGVSGAGTSN